MRMLPRSSVSRIAPYRRTDAVDAVDLELRNLTYAKVVELGRVPAPAEVAAAAGGDPGEVVAGWRRLHDQHALVLTAASRFRSRCAAGVPTTRACFSIASSPPPAGGTTSSSPEAR